jgi:hypothetical protein
MAAKHVATLLAAVLALAPLTSLPAKSQGILPLLQKPANSQAAQTGPVPSVSASPESPESYVPPDGYVPDAETAGKIGKVIIERYYGELPAGTGEKFTVTIENGIWIVKRTHAPGYFDGGGEVHISKKDGTILFLSDKT